MALIIFSIQMMNLIVPLNPHCSWNGRILQDQGMERHENRWKMRYATEKMYYLKSK
jgi:hypothetical protein